MSNAIINKIGDLMLQNIKDKLSKPNEIIAVRYLNQHLRYTKDSMKGGKKTKKLEEYNKIGFGILGKDYLMLITQDLKPKKNGRDIMRAGKRSFIGKSKELIQDEEYLEGIIKKLLLSEYGEWAEIGSNLSSSTVLDAMGYIFKEIGASMTIEELMKRSQDKSKCEIRLDVLPEFLKSMSLVSFKGTDRIKDMDNQSQLTQDSMQSAIKQVEGYIKLKKLPEIASKYFGEAGKDICKMLLKGINPTLISKVNEKQMKDKVEKMSGDEKKIGEKLVDFILNKRLIDFNDADIEFSPPLRCRLPVKNKYPTINIFIFEGFEKKML